MHYVTELKLRLAGKEKLARELENELKAIKAYVYSSKYDADPYVNKDDIALRVEQGISRAHDLAENFWLDQLSKIDTVGT